MTLPKSTIKTTPTGAKDRVPILSVLLGLTGNSSVASLKMPLAAWLPVIEGVPERITTPRAPLQIKAPATVA